MIVNFTFIGYVYITHDGSMVLLYVVCHGSHQYTPFMLAFFYQHQPDPSWVTCQSIPSLLEIAARNVVHRDMKPENLCPGCELQEMDPEVMAIFFMVMVKMGKTGWWFGTCFFVHSVGNFIIPTGFHILVCLKIGYPKSIG